MLNNKEEFEALTATLNDSGWAIYKRIITEDLKSNFVKAKRADNKDEAFLHLQAYKILEEVLQKPYNILKESEFNTQGDN